MRNKPSKESKSTNKGKKPSQAMVPEQALCILPPLGLKGGKKQKEKGRSLYLNKQWKTGGCDNPWPPLGNGSVPFSWKKQTGQQTEGEFLRPYATLSFYANCSLFKCWVLFLKALLSPDRSRQWKREEEMCEQVRDRKQKKKGKKG